MLIAVQLNREYGGANRNLGIGVDLQAVLPNLKTISISATDKHLELPWLSALVKLVKAGHFPSLAEIELSVMVVEVSWEPKLAFSVGFANPCQEVQIMLVVAFQCS